MIFMFSMTYSIVLIIDTIDLRLVFKKDLNWVLYLKSERRLDIIELCALYSIDHTQNLPVWN